MEAVAVDEAQAEPIRDTGRDRRLSAARHPHHDDGEAGA
jgi:hypothetical protein